MQTFEWQKSFLPVFCEDCHNPMFFGADNSDLSILIFINVMELFLQMCRKAVTKFKNHFTIWSTFKIGGLFFSINMKWSYFKTRSWIKQREIKKGRSISIYKVSVRLVNKILWVSQGHVNKLTSSSGLNGFPLPPTPPDMLNPSSGSFSTLTRIWVNMKINYYYHLRKSYTQYLTIGKIHEDSPKTNIQADEGKLQHGILC